MAVIGNPLVAPVSSGSELEIEWVTYGSSTSQDIEDAYDDGKFVVTEVEFSGVPFILPLVCRESSTSHIFASVDSATVYFAQCNSGTWTSGSNGIPVPQLFGVPHALGTASRGSASDYSRSDHVHAMPSASDVGAVAAPSSPSAGDVLTYNNGAWGAAAPLTETLWLTYGTQSATLSADIDAAYQANKAVYVIYNSGIFQLTYRASSTYHIFCNVGESTVQSFAVSNNLWNTVFAQNIPSPANATPASLGVAAIGSSTRYAKADHVHAMPSASDVGAIANPLSASSGDVLKYSGSAWAAASLSASDVGAIASPSSPTSGQYLMWNGSAWVAQSLPVYNGGVS